VTAAAPLPLLCAPTLPPRSIFKGQWKENNMHGCGKKWYPGGAIEEVQRLSRGSPVGICSAAHICAVCPCVCSVQGEWLEDNFVGDFGSCDAAEALATATDAEHVAASARDFMYKPDGGACWERACGRMRMPWRLTRVTRVTV
jgi:hypothetical protein